MIKGAGGKGARCVAVAAVVASWYVVERLAVCGDTIVAGFAQLIIYDGFGVVKSFRRDEGTGIVANTAI